MYSNIVVSCNHVLSSSLEDNLTSTAPATKAGFDRGSWVVSPFTERAFVRRQLKILLPTFCFRFAVPHFWWNVSTGMDWCWFRCQIPAQEPTCKPQPFHGDLSSSGHKADVEIDRLIFFVKRTPLFFTKLALKPAGAIDILNFSSLSNAMQTCKYQMVSWKSLVKFEWSLKLWFGFQDEGVNNDAGRDNSWGQGPLGDDIKPIT